jgi:hypothetical protein
MHLRLVPRSGAGPKKGQRRNEAQELCEFCRSLRKADYVDMLGFSLTQEQGSSAGNKNPVQVPGFLSNAQLGTESRPFSL